MELPIRGCLVKADGSVVSAWEWNHQGPFTQPVLIIEDPDGNRTNGYAPDDVVIDLTGVTEPGDMTTLYREQHLLKVEKSPNGKWNFRRHEDGVEVPSRFSNIMEARQKQRLAQNQKEVPNA